MDIGEILSRAWRAISSAKTQDPVDLRFAVRLWSSGNYSPNVQYTFLSLISLQFHLGLIAFRVAILVVFIAGFLALILAIS